MLPFDLHVLGMPPAFNLSQDQTLQFKNKTFNLKTSAQIQLDVKLERRFRRSLSDQAPTQDTPNLLSKNRPTSSLAPASRRVSQQSYFNFDCCQHLSENFFRRPELRQRMHRVRGTRFQLLGLCRPVRTQHQPSRPRYRSLWPPV